MRCFALTTNKRRCKRECEWVFCTTHRYCFWQYPLKLAGIFVLGISLVQGVSYLVELPYRECSSLNVQNIAVTRTEQGIAKVHFTLENRTHKAIALESVILRVLEAKPIIHYPVLITTIGDYDFDLSNADPRNGPLEESRSDIIPAASRSEIIISLRGDRVRYNTEWLLQATFVTSRCKLVSGAFSITLPMPGRW
jgi:hypothetical protein